MNRTRVLSLKRLGSAGKTARTRKQRGSMATPRESSEFRDSTLRRRHIGETSSSAKQSDHGNSETEQQNEKYDKKEKVRLGTGTYWITRIVLLRAVAFVYCEFCIFCRPTTIASGLLTEVEYKYNLKEFLCWL